jgi:hypothetical protein
MTVILSRYRNNEFMVTKDDVLKCKHMSEDRARKLASRLSGDENYVDNTKNVEKKPKKSKEDKGE